MYGPIFWARIIFFFIINLCLRKNKVINLIIFNYTLISTILHEAENHKEINGKIIALFAGNSLIISPCWSLVPQSSLEPNRALPHDHIPRSFSHCLNLRGDSGIHHSSVMDPSVYGHPVSSYSPPNSGSGPRMAGLHPVLLLACNPTPRRRDVQRWLQQGVAGQAGLAQVRVPASTS
ncbi:hypothetical protein HJG60_011288 [Phyllostomus discolor]|uniref:Uncharacterized protein n=1 Tax=Phyllostomus discolor TaxID=89673 RepID=A0A834E5E2_9CHIR|nr:hypothetical protein HJG60_011288 [Phyllostomus discolor]